MSRRDPYVSVRHMLDSARSALALFEERSRRGEWEADRVLNSALDDALVRRMEVIGEAARRVPDELRVRYPGIDWSRIVALRNVLIHEYDSVNLRLLREIIQNELPPLIEQLEGILGDNRGENAHA